MLIEDIGELNLIEKISSWLEITDRRVVSPIGDDASIVKPDSEKYAILTTDMLVEDVHFKLSTTPSYDLGYKAAAVQVSDVSAMAGLPCFLLVSLALPGTIKTDFVEQLYRGMDEVAKKCNLSIVGGDTTRSDKVILSLTLVGEVEPELVRKRSEAEVGQKILVTGALGASSAGLTLLSNPSLRGIVSSRDTLRDAHLKPPIRIEEARIASREGARAMEDISDGLASEVFHICKESRVGARVFLGKLPVAEGVAELAQAAGKEILDFVVYGGEDYELVVTAPEGKSAHLRRRVKEETQTKVTEIGKVVGAEKGMSLVDVRGQERKFKRVGYEHFR